MPGARCTPHPDPIPTPIPIPNEIDHTPSSWSLISFIRDRDPDRDRDGDRDRDRGSNDGRRFRHSQPQADAAEDAGTSGYIGHSSLRGSIYAMRAMNLFWMGRSGELLRTAPPQLRELERCRHLYGWFWLRLMEAWAL